MALKTHTNALGGRFRPFSGLGGLFSRNLPKIAFLGVLALFGPKTVFSQSLAPKDQVFDIGDWKSCGLVTRYSPNLIPKECLIQATNIVMDEDFSLSRRNGYSKYNATPCTDSKSVRGLWPFKATDGTQYMVILSSKTMFKTSGSGDCAQIAGLSNLSATAEMQCVQALGKLWCTNGTDTVFNWDGASTSPVSGAPLGNLIGTFRNRIVIGNIGGNLTRIRLSGELDGTDWTVFVPGKSTTSANIDIAGTNDGLPVTCLMGQYQDAYIIGREREIYALYGNDRRDFTLRKLSNEVGCIEPKSVQEKNNSLLWLSRRGMESLTGTTITRVSDQIRPTVDTIISASSNLNTKTLTSQADFTGGNANLQASGPGAPMSATISPGNVVPSSWGVTQSVGSDFTNWSSSSSVSTNTAPTVSLYYSTFNFSNGDFSYGDFTNWTNSGYVIGSGIHSLACQSSSPNSATASPASTNASRTTTLTLISSTGTMRSCTVTWSCACPSGGGILKKFSCSVASSTCDIDPSTKSLAGFRLGVSELGLNLGIKVTDSDTGAIITSIVTTPASAMAVLLSATSTTGTETTCPSPGTSAITMTGCGLPNYLPTGSFSSKVYDTALSTPVWGAFTASISSSTETPLTFTTQASSDGTSFDSTVAVTPGSRITSAAKRYIKYNASFSTSVSTKTPTISSIDLSARTTGYYISDCATPSSAISSWGNFRTSYINNSGSFTFWLATGTSCANATSLTANWTSQTPNSAIVVPTSTFVAARVLFTIDSGTQTPTLNDLQWEWNEGASRPPTASAVHKDRYYLFYTTDTASGAKNDHALVLDQNNKWTLYDDIYAYSATIYKNNLYTGSSSADGTIYQQVIGQDDAGSQFTTTFQTPDLSFGEPSRLKLFKTLYLETKGEATAGQGISMSVSYQIDGSTTSYSLGTVLLTEADESSGYLVAKVPFTNNQADSGRYVSFTVSYTGSQGPLKIYSMRVIYEPIDLQ